MANGDENAENIDMLHCIGLQILDAQAGNAGVVAQNFIKRTVVENGDLAGLLFLEQFVLHDFLGAELLAAMNQGDVAGDIGQIKRFFNRRIAATNDGNRFAAVKETIASGTGGNALAGKFLFRGQAEILSRGAGGNNQRIAGIGAGVADQRERLLGQLCRVNLIENNFCLEAASMRLKTRHQFGTLHAISIRWPVVHFGGGHQLAALGHTGDQHRFQIGAGGIDGGSVTGGAGAQDNEGGVANGLGHDDPLG